MKTRLLLRTVNPNVLADVEAPPRTPGVHVTDIISLVMRKFDEKWDKPLQDKDAEAWREGGFTWERTLSKSFAERATLGGAQMTRMPELQMDGVLLSPDWLGQDEHGLFDFEAKLTWKSAAGFDLETLKFLPWLFQFRAYAHALGLTRTVYRVFFVNGDYKRYVPEIQDHEILHSPDELRANWRMLVKTAKDAGWL